MGPGAATPPTGDPFHNMGVYGWDVLDAQMLTATTVARRLEAPPEDDLVRQVAEHHQDRAAWPVLQRARRGSRPRTVLDAARDLARSSEGVETLVVMLGSNNVLGSVVSLEPAWTQADYADLSPEQRMAAKRGRNVFRPSAFAADWELLVQRLRAVEAQHVIVATVPSVTIAPIARGTNAKVRPDSRYFPYYTRPWITDDDFDPRRDPHITGDEAQAIDSAIDAYNETIIASVEAARRDGLDWYVFDMGGLLDRLATRRYINSPWARPAGWTPYELPAALRALDPVPNTRFFRAGPERPHRRRAVLPRRGPPHHRGVRRHGPGGHPHHGAGRRRLPRPRRQPAHRTGDRRLRAAAGRRHVAHPPPGRGEQHPQPARAGSTSGWTGCGRCCPSRPRCEPRAQPVEHLGGGGVPVGLVEDLVARPVVDADGDVGDPGGAVALPEQLHQVAAAGQRVGLARDDEQRQVGADRGQLARGRPAARRHPNSDGTVVSGRSKPHSGSAT